MSENKQFETWGVVELFGHLRLAGMISEQSFGPATMIRIDVPAVGDQPGYSRLFGVAAVYGITPTSEDIARGIANTLRAKPIQHYELPQISHSKDYDQQNDDDDF